MSSRIQTHCVLEILARQLLESDQDYSSLKRGDQDSVIPRATSTQPCETVDMATAKPSNSTEIEDIQRRMAQIRHDMHGEVLARSRCSDR